MLLNGRGAAPADPAVPPHDVAAPAPEPGTGAFGRWFRSRPAIGGLVTVLAGAALFGSTQLDLGALHVQLGIEGMQATILPIVLALCGVLAVVTPDQRLFYGVVALAVAVYSLVAVNLGGFFAGFLLGASGGVLIVSWMPRTARPRRRRDAAAAEDPSADGTAG